MTPGEGADIVMVIARGTNDVAKDTAATQFDINGRRSFLPHVVVKVGIKNALPKKSFDIQSLHFCNDIIDFEAASAIHVEYRSDLVDPALPAIFAHDLAVVAKLVVLRLCVSEFRHAEVAVGDRVGSHWLNLARWDCEILGGETFLWSTDFLLKSGCLKVIWAENSEDFIPMQDVDTTAPSPGSQAPVELQTINDYDDEVTGEDIEALRKHVEEHFCKPDDLVMVSGPAW